MAEIAVLSQGIQMKNPIQGNPKYLQYRVETPYKNGHLDHIFVSWQDAIKFCDQSAGVWCSSLIQPSYKQGYTLQHT